MRRDKGKEPADGSKRATASSTQSRSSATDSGPRSTQATPRNNVPVKLSSTAAAGTRSAGTPLAQSQVPRSSGGSVPATKPPPSSQRNITSAAKPNVVKFLKILSESGVKVPSDKLESYTVSDAMKFERHLCSNLSMMNEALLGNFLDGMKTLFSDDGELEKALEPLSETTLSTSQFQSLRRSLIKVLLAATQVQPTLVDFLMEKLPQLTEEIKSDTPIVPLILGHLRWIDTKEDSARFTNKVLEVLSVCAPDLQKEILGALPDMISESEHPKVLDTVQSFLEHPGFTGTVLDTLANLNLPDDILACFHYRFLTTYSNRMDPNPKKKVIDEMRTSLEYAFRTSLHSKNKASQLDERFTLEAIRNGIRFSKDLSEAFLKAIKTITDPNDHTSIDIILLLLIHTVSSQRKAVESLFKSKIDTNHFTQKLFTQGVFKHPDACLEYMPQLISLTEPLMRATISSTRDFASFIYSGAFSAFGDHYARQEILNALITHLSSCNAVESNAALSALEELTNTSRGVLGEFIGQIKGVLEHIDNMSPVQIRRLYSVLSSLSFHWQNNQLIKDDLLHSDFSMLIRKQLGHPNFKYKLMGIVGAAALIKRIAHETPINTDMPEDASDCLNVLFEMLHSCCKNSTSLSFMMDELSSTIFVPRATVHPEVLKQLALITKEDFMSNFTAPIESPNELWYNLSEDSDTVINIMPLADSHNLLETLCPHFRLLSLTLKHTSDAAFADLEPLLSCPLKMFDENNQEELLKTSQGRNSVCQTLFFSIQWFRELLNVFHNSDNIDIQSHVLERLQQITELEAKLEDVLKSHTNFTLSPGILWGQKSPSLGVGKKSKKLQPTLGCFPLVDTLRPFFRELELRTLKILAYQRASGSDTTSKTAVQLDPLALEVLVRELHETILHEFCSQQKKVPFSAPTQTEPFKPASATRTTSYLPMLMHPLAIHLDKACAQIRIATEGEKSISILSRCMYMGLQCFETMTRSLSHIKHPEAAKLQQGLLNALAPKGLTDPSAQFHAAFERFLNMADGVKYLYAAMALVGLLSALSGQDPPKPSGILASTAAAPCSPFGSVKITADLKEHKRQVSELAGSFLARKWSESLSGQEDIVKYLLQSWISFSPHDTLHTIICREMLALAETLTSPDPEEVATDGAADANNQVPPSDHTTTVSKRKEVIYNTLSSGTLDIYYAVAFDHVNTGFAVVMALANKTEPQVFLQSVELYVNLFYHLLEYTKHSKTAFCSKFILKKSLKFGKTFLFCFIRNIAIVKANLLNNDSQIIKILSLAQKGIRRLQILCEHGKGEHNAALVRDVPAVKRVIERFILEMRRVFSSLDAEGILQIGTLKSRNIEGEVLEKESVASSKKDEPPTDDSDLSASDPATSDPDTDADSNEEEANDEPKVDEDDEDAGDDGEHAHKGKKTHKSKKRPPKEPATSSRSGKKHKVDTTPKPKKSKSKS
ncbi:Fanconi anemia group D2 protein [Pelomyxa schiedti]|nr:Fanconi anemia group D2 protein [Pelomyxa schiedti]